MARIAIIGAGAIGSAIGALLSRAGQDVTLIARLEHAERIRREGLHVEGVLGSFTVPIAAATALDFRPDYAFLTVKTQDVVAAVQANIGFLGGVPVVTFQNGVRSDELVATLLPPEQIISGVVSLTATYLMAGTVTIVHPGALIVGRPSSRNDIPVIEVAALLRGVTATRISANIQGAHWLKLLMNLNNAFPALTNRPLRQVYAEPYLRRLAVRVMREGYHATQRTGIRLESLPEASVGLFKVMARLPLWLAGWLVSAASRRMGTAQPILGSTLQSLRRGRPTEIDYLNGEVVRLGQQWHVPAPLNAAIVAMVHQTEQTGEFWTVQAIRKAIEQA
jgi:2-dehydropantoate 2-reductase